MDDELSFWQHLNELRLVLLRSLIAIVICFVLSLLFYDQILAVLMSPLKPLELKLIVLSPLEGFLTTLKVCFWSACVLSSPLWLIFVLQFIQPALHRNEKKIIIPFILSSFVFIFLGALTAYRWTIPLASLYFYHFNAPFAENLWTFSSFVSFSLYLMVANAMAFEIGVILFLLVHYGFVHYETLSSKRRFAILAAFILGALLTPPDVPSQLVMASVLILFYEMAILYAKFKRTKYEIRMVDRH